MEVSITIVGMRTLYPQRVPRTDTLEDRSMLCTVSVLQCDLQLPLIKRTVKVRCENR